MSPRRQIGTPVLNQKTVNVPFKYKTYEMPTPIRRWRVMFADGLVVDVLAWADTSTMREWILNMVYGPVTKNRTSIIGVTEIKET